MVAEVERGSLAEVWNPIDDQGRGLNEYAVEFSVVHPECFVTCDNLLP